MLQRWDAWVGLSDEATRESERGGPAGLKQSLCTRPGAHGYKQPTTTGFNSHGSGRRTLRGSEQLAARCLVCEGSYLVDPASSHMLVSKIKPCMSKYKLLYTVKLRMAH